MCMWAVMPLARLCGCAGLSEPSLVACSRGTIISWTGSFHWQPNIKQDAEACKNQFISWFGRLYVRVMIHRNHLMCLIHNTISWGRRAWPSDIKCIELFYYAYCVRVLVNLENHRTRIKLMFTSKFWVSEQRDPDEIAQKHMLSWAFTDHI